jgi:HD superfamily phosphodiesterase
LLMKTLNNMATENEKAAPAPTGSQATQQVATQPSALGYLRKQDLAQLEAIVTELMARMEALEGLQAQLMALQQRVADLEATVSQIQGLTQDAISQSVKNAMEAVEERVQPLAKEIAKTMLLVAEALKKTNTQKI